MKQSEAIAHLRVFMLALQRYRSIVMEQLGGSKDGLHLSEKMAAEMWPWVFGEKCPLPMLSKILNDVAGGKQLVPLDYYNMMFILDRFTPEIKAVTNSRLIQARVDVIPEGPPSLTTLNGWEPE